MLCNVFGSHLALLKRHRKVKIFSMALSTLHYLTGLDYIYKPVIACNFEIVIVLADLMASAANSPGLHTAEIQLFFSQREETGG